VHSQFARGGTQSAFAATPRASKPHEADARRTRAACRAPPGPPGLPMRACLTACGCMRSALPSVRHRATHACAHVRSGATGHRPRRWEGEAVRSQAARSGDRSECMQMQREGAGLITRRSTWLSTTVLTTAPRRPSIVRSWYSVCRPGQWPALWLRYGTCDAFIAHSIHFVRLHLLCFLAVFA